jgi:hypothetical protein
MKWSDVRLAYPEQWLVVEALVAYTTADSYRVPDNLAVLESCIDGHVAMQRYRVLHQAYPGREFYYVHTSRESLVLRERQWLGVRRNDEALAAG